MQRDAHRLNSLHEAAVGVFLEGNRACERSGLYGELHHVVELFPDHSQISVGHAVRRVIHDVLDDRFVLIEVFSIGVVLRGLGPMLRRGIEPTARCLYVVHEFLHERRVFVDELLPHSEDAAHVVGPFVACHAQWDRVSCTLRSGAIGLTGAVRVDGFGKERGGHIGRRHLGDSDVLYRHALLRQFLAEKKIVDREAAGDGNSLASEVPEIPIGRVSTHHDHGARPVTDGDYLYRDVLRNEIHHQRRQHVSGVDLSRDERFLDFRPAVVAPVFEVRPLRRYG